MSYKLRVYSSSCVKCLLGCLLVPGIGVQKGHTLFISRLTTFSFYKGYLLLVFKSSWDPMQVADCSWRTYSQFRGLERG
jgi:hypothetical protein